MNIRDVLGCPSIGMGTGVTLVAGGSIGQARLRITGPAAGGVGAGIQLTESSDKKSEILTTGGAAAQGPGKPNLAACSAHSGGQRHFSINYPWVLPCWF
jgi:hypothetical protein